MQERLYQLGLAAGESEPAGPGSQISPSAVSANQKSKKVKEKEEKEKAKEKEKQKEQKSKGEEPPPSGVAQGLQSTPTGFAPVWAALQLLFCLPEAAGPLGEMVSNEAEFGHGFAIGGAAIAALLGVDAHAADLGGQVLRAQKHGARLQACVSRSPAEAAAEAAVAAAAAQGPGGEEDPAQLARFLRAVEDQQRAVAFAAPLVLAKCVKKDVYRQKRHTLFRPPST
jgi:hypothetical protein